VVIGGRSAAGRVANGLRGVAGRSGEAVVGAPNEVHLLICQR